MPAKHVALDALLYFQTNDSYNFFTLAKTRAFPFACRFEQRCSLNKRPKRLKSPCRYFKQTAYLTKTLLHAIANIQSSLHFQFHARHLACNFCHKSMGRQSEKNDLKNACKFIHFSDQNYRYKLCRNKFTAK